MSSSYVGVWQPLGVCRRREMLLAEQLWGDRFGIFFVSMNIFWALDLLSFWWLLRRGLVVVDGVGVASLSEIW